MHYSGDALLLSVLPHGEHGAVVRLLTGERGLLAGYVRGGRSRRLRPILIPGNAVAVDWRSRVEEQLGGVTVELRRSRAPALSGRASSAALAWVTALTASALPEQLAYPRLHGALSALLELIDEGPSPRLLLASVARYELLLLQEIGFGLELQRCAATGETGPGADLAFVSPRSAQAVSRAAGSPYAAKLLPLPAFITGQSNAAPPGASDLADAFRLTGYFLARDVLTGHLQRLTHTRELLTDQIKTFAAAAPASL